MIICKCGHQNSDESLFCSECGSPLTMSCPFCHAELTRNSKFCQCCGKSVTKASGNGNTDSSALPNGSVVAGDVHTTIIYNQENKKAEPRESSFNKNGIYCHECGKRLPISSQYNLQCTVCGLYFCNTHIDLQTHRCYGCYEKVLSAFEYRRFDNGKYAILGVKNKDSLSIVIPDCVESIEDGAFCGCKMLTITLPKSLLKIGDRAFADCRGLTSIRFPNSLKVIGKEAFAGCERLDGYIIPGGITIGEDAFKGTLLDVRRQKTQNHFRGGFFAHRAETHSETQPKEKKFPSVSAKPIEPAKPVGSMVKPVEPAKPVGGMVKPVEPAKPVGSMVKPVEPVKPTESDKPVEFAESADDVAAVKEETSVEQQPKEKAAPISDKLKLAWNGFKKSLTPHSTAQKTEEQKAERKPDKKKSFTLIKKKNTAQATKTEGLVPSPVEAEVSGEDTMSSTDMLTQKVDPVELSLSKYRDQKRSMMLWGIFYLLVFFPISLYFFYKMNRASREIKRIESGNVTAADRTVPNADHIAATLLKLERQKKSRLIRAIVFVFLFWPLSVYWFWRVREISREIDSLFAGKKSQKTRAQKNKGAKSTPVRSQREFSVGMTVASAIGVHIFNFLLLLVLYLLWDNGFFWF